ncbi:MAG: hypothetical protein PSX42_05840 [bacterium]|jgi:hypothetical protein|nr:hypothetical protein [bacterium]
MEDNIIDFTMSEMNLNDFSKIPFNKIIDDLKVSRRDVINAVDASESKGLIEFSGNTHISARLTRFGFEIVKHGGWLKYIQNEKSELNFIAEKERIEFEKSKIDLELSKKMLKEFPKTKWFARIGFVIAIILAVLEIIQWNNK